MGWAQQAKLGFFWLLAIVLSCVFVWIAYQERSAYGWFGVGSMVVIALCLWVAFPLIAALNSSGKWYTLKALQPELEISEHGMRWQVKPRNDILRAVVLAPIFVGLGVYSIFIAPTTGGRGAVMPVFGVLMLVFIAWFTVKAITNQVSAELRGDELMYRVRKYPFRVLEHHVSRINNARLYAVTDPVPIGCQLWVQGPTTTTRFWRGRPSRVEKASEVKVPVPYLRNATPHQVQDLITRACNAPQI
ncbi:hypothetical protein [Corynebacterium riegelii]|uniref:hypothetical protein n=1 Tax=Corynebacterium riegelii TaxID=156976 RepID=UPI000C77BF44|nr:hypothetical protein [Corynebacterium riegelii]PLA13204.1 hypothetical protein CYJ48_07030 [Corynebacterium riegelii]